MKTAQERQRVYVFETSQKTQIGALVAAYRPSLANHDAEITLANQKRRVKQVTNEDRLRLQGNLVNCRRALIEQNLVKRPPVGANGESGTIHDILIRMFLNKFTKSLNNCLVKQPQVCENGESDTNLIAVYYICFDRLKNC